MVGSDRDAIFAKEEQLDKEGRGSMQEWERKGCWKTYPTGYGKVLGVLSTEEKLILEQYHTEAMQRHQERANLYRHYRNGDPDTPAPIGGL